MNMNGVARDYRRLMIADDDPLARSMLSVSLSDSFKIVGVAPDAEAAIELARTSQPHVALVDVEMPQGGGLSAVHGIVGVSPKTAIVVLSGDESDGMVRALMQAGAVAYCRKGIPPQALIACLVGSIHARAGERDRSYVALGPVS